MKSCRASAGSGAEGDLVFMTWWAMSWKEWVEDCLHEDYSRAPVAKRIQQPNGDEMLVEPALSKRVGRLGVAIIVEPALHDVAEVDRIARRSEGSSPLPCFRHIERKRPVTKRRSGDRPWTG